MRKERRGGESIMRKKGEREQNEREKGDRVRGDIEDERKREEMEK